jgi:hypothetical protein
VTQSNSIAIAVTKSVRGISRFGVRRQSPHFYRDSAGALVLAISVKSKARRRCALPPHPKLFLPLRDHHRQVFSHRGVQLLDLPFLLQGIFHITEHQVANR